MDSNTLTTDGIQELAEKLPRGFHLGVATAAYQIEGSTEADGRLPCIWDTFAATPGRTQNGESGAEACDHYRRWEADYQLMSDLGIKHYRMSLAWARLQPTGRGELNPAAVEFYRKQLSRLNELGIRPLVTLYHWDLPQTLEDEGGWAVRSTALAFEDYARQVVESLGEYANDWITLNEPWCITFLGYGYGEHAPGRAEIQDAVAAAHHVNLAHGLAVKQFRKLRPDLKVGITNLVTDLVPLTDSPEDLAAVRRLDANNNRIFLDPVYTGAYSQEVVEVYGQFGLTNEENSEGLVKPGDLAVINEPGDFAGINHYQRIIVRADSSVDNHLKLVETPAEPATTDMGWSVVPQSIGNALMRMSEYTELPIIVTENGAAYADAVDPTGAVLDPSRVDYLRRYLSVIAETAAKEVNIQGYYAWSFLDNYEWAYGYQKRFGLVYVDYSSQRRIPKSSAKWYAQLIAQYSAM